MSLPFIYVVKKCVWTRITIPRLTSQSYHRCWCLKITREKYQHLSQNFPVWMSPECLVKAKVTWEKYFYWIENDSSVSVKLLQNITKYLQNNIYPIAAPDSSPTFPMTESPPPGYITDDGDGVSSPGSNVSSSGEKIFLNNNLFKVKYVIWILPRVREISICQN